MILLIRSDRPEVFIGLWGEGKKLTTKSWGAGRELSIQILKAIENICLSQKKTMKDLKGIVVYEGPGSYTGLRIGVSTANALAKSYEIPVVGVSGQSWQQDGLKKIINSSGFSQVSPVYGRDVYITSPRK